MYCTDLFLEPAGRVDFEVSRVVLSGAMSETISRGGSGQRSLAKCDWPAVGSLASLLEESKLVRERARECGHITRWPSDEATGVPSVKAMGLNAFLLARVAGWFCAYSDYPAVIPIDLCRREVFWLQS